MIEAGSGQLGTTSRTENLHTDVETFTFAFGPRRKAATDRKRFHMESNQHDLGQTGGAEERGGGGPKEGSIINPSKNLKAVSDEETDPEIGVTFECGS